jgi:hypothetical protein
MSGAKLPPSVSKSSFQSSIRLLYFTVYTVTRLCIAMNKNKFGFKWKIKKIYLGFHGRG